MEPLQRPELDEMLNGVEEQNRKNKNKIGKKLGTVVRNIGTLGQGGETTGESGRPSVEQSVDDTVAELKTFVDKFAEGMDVIDSDLGYNVSVGYVEAVGQDEDGKDINVTGSLYREPTNGEGVRPGHVLVNRLDLSTHRDEDGVKSSRGIGIAFGTDSELYLMHDQTFTASTETTPSSLVDHGNELLAKAGKEKDQPIALSELSAQDQITILSEVQNALELLNKEGIQNKKPEVA